MDFLALFRCATLPAPPCLHQPRSSPNTIIAGSLSTLYHRRFYGGFVTWAGLTQSLAIMIYSTSSSFLLKVPTLSNHVVGVPSNQLPSWCCPRAPGPQLSHKHSKRYLSLWIYSEGFRKGRERPNMHFLLCHTKGREFLLMSCSMILAKTVLWAKGQSPRMRHCQKEDSEEYD